MSMTYGGEVEITERDPAAHRAVMKARAKESRGQGTADADVTMVLAGDEMRTSATVTTEVALSGKVATMGQGVLQDVSGRLVKTFAQNLAAMLEQGGPAAPTLPEPPPPAAAAPEAQPPGPGAAAPPPPPPPPPPAPEPAEALDLGSLGGAMVAERLRDPRVLAALLAGAALAGYIVGRRAG
jgi:carbon monoxide dehydrogenase subunit G